MVEETELPEGDASCEFTRNKANQWCKSNDIFLFIKDISRKRKTEQQHTNGYSTIEHGGIIKHEVFLSSVRTKGRKLLDAVQSLKQKGLDPAVKESVHPQTLNAFVKEQMTSGKDLPADLFGDIRRIPRQT